MISCMSPGRGERGVFPPFFNPDPMQKKIQIEKKTCQDKTS